MPILKTEFVETLMVGKAAPLPHGCAVAGFVNSLTTYPASSYRVSGSVFLLLQINLKPIQALQTSRHAKRGENPFQGMPDVQQSGLVKLPAHQLDAYR